MPTDSTAEERAYMRELLQIERAYTDDDGQVVIVILRGGNSETYVPVDAVRAAAQAEGEKRELACIRAVCPACEQGSMPLPHPTLGAGPWLHSGLSICKAFGIYELRRKREEKRGAD